MLFILIHDLGSEEVACNLGHCENLFLFCVNRFDYIFLHFFFRLKRDICIVTFVGIAADRIANIMSITGSVGHLYCQSS